MLLSNLITPNRTVYGKFAARVSFPKNIAGFTQDNIILTGDTTGVAYQIFGTGRAYSLQFALPPLSAGQFTIGLTGKVFMADVSEMLTLKPVASDVVYDTQKTIHAECGEAEHHKDGRITVPIKFAEPVIGFTKRHLSVRFGLGKGKYLLYGSDSEYLLELRPQRRSKGIVHVEFGNQVTKANGITVAVDIPELEIDYPL